MKRRLTPPAIFGLLTLLALVASVAVQADTIRLKNGRTIEGQVLSFGNGEFVVALPAAQGSTTGQDRMIVLAGDVDTITFSATGAATTTSGTAAPSEQLVVVGTGKDVTSTGIQVQQGETVRVRASGEVQFPDGRVSPPAGLDTRESWPFPGERFGVLVAMVGDPNSTIYHVIGDNGTFQAQRDGELLLQINARSLQGAKGAYTARVQAGSGADATTTTTTTDQGMTPAPYSQPRRLTLTIPANQDWTDTGIDLREGESLHVTATGNVKFSSSDPATGPNGAPREWKDLIRSYPVNDAGRGALIGLIGEKGVATPFLVGQDAKFEVQKNGRLFLGVNDNQYGDNTGSFQVTVDVTPASQ